MTELDISRTIRQPEKPVPREKKLWTDGKTLVLSILVLALVLSLTVGGWKISQTPSGASTVVLDVDGLHKLNREGKISDERGYIYNGYSFVEHEGLWWTELMLFDTLVKVPLHFGPREVEHIRLSGELDSTAFNTGENVSIAIDPGIADKYYTLAISELSFNLVEGMRRTPVGSCTKEDPGCEGREIVSCNNTQGRPVIELALGPAGIKAQGSCFLVSGTGYELVKAVDRLLWQWYGVMEKRT